MPLIELKIAQGIFDAAEKQAIIETLTDTMVTIEGAALRPVTCVTLRRSPAATGATRARLCTPTTSSGCAPRRRRRQTGSTPVDRSRARSSISGPKTFAG